MRRLVPSSLRSLVVLGCLAAVLVAVATGKHVAARPPKDAVYIGQKKCRVCHFKEYRSWKKTKHAKAWDNLPEKDRSRPECYRCHVTGFDRSGGYLSEEETPQLTGVQCEACHGPGDVHAEVAKEEESEEKIDALTDKVPQNTCNECHNAHKTHEDYEVEYAEAETAASEAATTQDRGNGH